MHELFNVAVGITLVLFIFVLIGRFSSTEKRVKLWLMLSRLAYLTLFVISIINDVSTWQIKLVWTLGQITLVLIAALLVEFIFAHKQETHVDASWLWGLAICLVLTIYATLTLAF
ncbi:hypothetical protein [Furfurilactobacillus curtus]|uniref:DUF1516 family protein n=1 Tax=Furfurilactobacillus curtus TaxID=1746200 RepID=A0ABQ5JNR3_9LACO